MPAPDQAHALDNIVVVLFENPFTGRHRGVHGCSGC